MQFLPLLRSLLLSLASLLLLVALLALPATGDLQSDLEGALGQIMAQFNGLELVEPTLIPEPPDNSYGCTNMSDTTVNMIPGESSVEVVITTNNLFVNFAVVRSWGICIPEFPPGPCSECFGSGSPVDSDGDLLGSATLSVVLTITEESPCTTVAVQPGSLALDFGTPDQQIQGDNCLASVVGTLRPLAVPVFELALSTALEGYLISVNDEINDMICNTTPTAAGS